MSIAFSSVISFSSLFSQLHSELPTLIAAFTELNEQNVKLTAESVSLSNFINQLQLHVSTLTTENETILQENQRLVQEQGLMILKNDELTLANDALERDRKRPCGMCVENEDQLRKWKEMAGNLENEVKENKETIAKLQEGKFYWRQKYNEAMVVIKEYEALQNINLPQEKLKRKVKNANTDSEKKDEAKRINEDFDLTQLPTTVQSATHSKNNIPVVELDLYSNDICANNLFVNAATPPRHEIKNEVAENGKKAVLKAVEISKGIPSTEPAKVGIKRKVHESLHPATVHWESRRQTNLLDETRSVIGTGNAFLSKPRPKPLHDEIEEEKDAGKDSKILKNNLFIDSVRGKEARKKLNGYTCTKCQSV